MWYNKAYPKGKNESEEQSMKKNVIWSDCYEDIEALARDIAEDNGEKVLDRKTIDKYINKAYDLNYEYLADERINLDKKVDGEIVIIGDLGLWDGRRIGYKLLGNNIKDCFEMGRDCMEAEWYCDRYDLAGVEHHHDGTNYYTYRMRKPNISETSWENFLDKIYRGVVTSKDITRYTKSLRPYIAEVYGW